MDGKPLDIFLGILSTMKNYGDRWGKTHVDAYEFGLANIPNSAVPILCRSVQAEFDERPTVRQIITHWRQICEPASVMSTADALELVWGLVRKYGEAGAEDPRSPNIRYPGEPQELVDAPDAVRQTIRAMGGWVSFCREESPDSVLRAQFERIYKAAVAGTANDSLRQARLEYSVGRSAAQAQVPMSDKTFTHLNELVRCIGKEMEP